jgi:hypothetical protein
MARQSVRPRPMTHLIAIIGLTGAFCIPGSDCVFAQAGSVGGTIGKQDKSESGGTEESEAPARRHHGAASGERHTSLSVTGRWSWTQKCDDATEWSGEFNLVQDSEGSVSGTASGNDGSGAMTGRLTGNTLTGSRGYALATNQIIFTLAAGGNSMQGSEVSRSHGKCRYQAKRN